MTKHIIAVDPGKLSGYVSVYYDEKTQTLTDLQTAELSQMDLCDRLNDELTYETTLVYEKFFITPETGKKNDTHYSLEIIGVMKYLAYIVGILSSTYSYSPSSAKNFTDNKRLHTLGLWHKGGEGHANDALRHLILHLVKEEGWRPEGLLG